MYRASALYLVIAVICGAGHCLGFRPLGGRSIESKCRTYLRAAVSAELTWFQDCGRFTTCVHDVSFRPEGHTRYAYFFGDGPLQRPYGPEVRDATGFAPYRGWFDRSRLPAL